MAEDRGDDTEADDGDTRSATGWAARLDPLLTDSWSRPAVSERMRLWIAWIGAGRLVGGVGATLVLAGLGWWLMRSPELPTEAALPAVSHSAPPSPSSSTSPTGPSAPPTSPTPAAVIVHVTGAVLRPGVYEMVAGQRVDDALAAAGGPTATADANSLNLAAPVSDGDRIEVPVLGRTSAPAADASGSGHTHATPGTDQATSPPVDLNEAGVAELEALPGIGPATASAIVEYRTSNGPFATVDQLLDVPGIGPAKLDAVRQLVTT